MRVFVALEVPAHVASRVERAVAPLRDHYDGLRWTRPSAWHVTLAFLGEVDDNVAGRVREAVAAGVAAAGPGRIALRLGGPGTFGRRVLWLAIDDEPSGAVARLGAAIQTEVVAAGLPCDEKEVHPHLTLARPRGRGRIPGPLVDETPTVEVAWTVDEAQVLRSHLGPDGSRYETLAAVPLTT